MNLPVGHYLQNKKYQLLQVVGQGGFGITYKGLLFTEVKGPLGAIRTEVPIGIKEYFFKDYCYRAADGLSVNVHSETGRVLFGKFKDKLIKEAKILSDVHHPNIVNVLDVFEENNTAYIAMEYIAGYSLKYILEKDGVLPEDRLLKYTHQIGKALQFVHEKNILHLDIKPSNILIDRKDNARLIDFGVSKRYDVENTETSTTMLTLSKGFASIEQYDNEGTHLFSPCPDIYSLGATMYNLLTGKIPTESILRATRTLPDPSELNPDITPATEKVILKAMQINPADRYRSLTEMLADLDMPSFEEKTENNYREETNTCENGDDDDEDTQFYHTTLMPNIKTSHAGTNNRKKRKRRTLAISLICIFVAMGTSVAIFVGKGKGTTLASIDLPPATEKDIEGNEPLKEETTTDNGSVIPESGAPDETNTQGNSQPDVKQPDDITLQPQLMPTPQPTIEEDTEAEYTALISSGKEKMNAGNYAGADADFSKAMSLKATEEVRQLFISIKEKQIEDKNALYEEKATFGKYKIVRNIQTQKYGAIDSRGEEKITCQYVYSEKAGENQAFQREDNLYDIYDIDGVLIKSRVTYW
ncbi:MAG: serine/threonine protein kinase [Tannerellaceae bacterium]|jgi:serine/threonine-protein kinase|nr:serine/threonine protein kinase [Tannerellaceae bacterium]